MKIAVISDIHDHIHNLRQACKMMQQAEALLCCGDLCSPFIVKELAEGFPNKNIHIVFGNNDGDLFRITQKASEYEHLFVYGEFCEIVLDSRKIAVHHFDNVGRQLAWTARYDLVCFGHNHQFEISNTGSTLVVNPGEIMGELTGQASFVMYDSRSHQAEKRVVS